jgi:hypothetical protein
MVGAAFFIFGAGSFALSWCAGKMRGWARVFALSNPPARCGVQAMAFETMGTPSVTESVVAKGRGSKFSC